MVKSPFFKKCAFYGNGFRSGGMFMRNLSVLVHPQSLELASVVSLRILILIPWCFQFWLYMLHICMCVTHIYIYVCDIIYIYIWHICHIYIYMCYISLCYPMLRFATSMKSAPRHLEVVKLLVRQVGAKGLSSGRSRGFLWDVGIYLW